jgi:prepilin-type N-terminal cleavage/methylation domain-containing protein
MRLVVRVFKKRSDRGFTLIEIMLVAGILAFVLCAILAAYISCSVLVATSKNLNIATNAALGLMEEIRTSSFTRIYDEYNGLNFILNDIPSSRGVVYVDDTNPELLEVTISVCWRQGNRIIGEDVNLNGVLDAGEDANGNGIIDSSVQMVTQIANR